jgi:hypothetical protein
MRSSSSKIPWPSMEDRFWQWPEEIQSPLQWTNVLEVGHRYVSVELALSSERLLSHIGL